VGRAVPRCSTEANARDKASQSDGRERWVWNQRFVGTVPPNSNAFGGHPVPVRLENHVGECELRLQVPATVDHLRTVRLVAADAGERAGFDCDETDDLRIAVDELCHAVMNSSDAPVVLGFAVTPGVVEVRGAAERNNDARPLEMSAISELVVDSVSDSYELVDGPRGVGFVLVKRMARARTGFA
jgi:anti-sigma regulatory factor (Ser/Thr protein kinase)